MEPCCFKITLALEKRNIQTRPNASHGLWLIFLLPISLIFSYLAHPIVSTATYKLSSILSIGYIITSIIFIYELSQNRKYIFKLWLLLPCLMVAALLRVCLHKSLFFCLGGGITATLVYEKIYKTLLYKLPQSFTLGEAAVCCQSYVLLLFYTTLNIFKILSTLPSNVMQQSTFVIQISLTALSAIIFLIQYFQIKDTFKLYTLLISGFLFLVHLPLRFVLQQEPIFWILSLLWDDLQKNKLVLWWIIFSFSALAVVYRRIKKAQKASSSIRKIFHILCTAVFIPGILYNCSLLYLASGLLLGLFFILEMFRILKIPPIGETLENGVVVFLDEKDAGIVALTPIYLLTGCSLPLWIHPAPCDVTNSGIFNLLPLLSGVLTTGIGDMAASIVGSKYGRHYWRDSKKTIEGTLACLISMQVAIYAFVYLDFIRIYSNMDHVKIFTTTFVASLVEAKTDQMDNLVLPFVTYIFFIWQ